MILRRLPLISGAVWLGLGPLPQLVQAQERRWISILHSGFPDRTPIHLLFEALRAHGFEDGRSATVELLGGEGDPERLKSLIAQLTSQKPDVIIALTPPAALGLKQAGTTIPVVFAYVPDPVGLGLVNSLARPSGNFTGITYSNPTLGGKRLEILLDAVPGVKRVAVIGDFGFTGNAAMVHSIKSSAAAHGVEIYVRQLAGLEDLDTAFADAEREGSQAVVFLSDNLLYGHRKKIAELELSHHLPAIHSFSLEVTDGSLMSYGPNPYESYERAAALTERILKGSRPADLPVEEPTRFTLSINMKTANSLGLTLSPLILARADEVIE